MNEIRIISFDPGTTTIGVSFFTINATSLEIIDIYTTLYDLSVTYVEDDSIEPLLSRLQELYSRVLNDVIEFKPSFASIENSFINRLRPGAFGPLSKSIGIIELAIIKAGVCCKIFKFAPKYIKKITTMNGTADKDSVLFGVRGIDEISSKVDLPLLSEHEVDSLATGYTLIKYLRENHHLLIT